MDWISIILIAIGLAMDCFAVSIGKGLATAVEGGNRHLLGVSVMALLFGLFQGGMPLIGYCAGTMLTTFFSRFAPWIALVLLAFIGGKMIWESLHKKEEEVTADFSPLTLLVLAVATSIDALVTGVIFIPCRQWLWMGISVIAATSFVFSVVGFVIGKEVGKKFHFNVELVGGMILVAIGIKICIEGLCS